MVCRKDNAGGNGGVCENSSFIRSEAVRERAGEGPSLGQTSFPVFSGLNFFFFERLFFLFNYLHAAHDF